MKLECQILLKSPPLNLLAGSAHGLGSGAVADPDQAYGGASQMGGPQNGFHLLKYQRLSATVVGYHTKLLPRVGQKSGCFFDRTMRFFME